MRYVKNKLFLNAAIIIYVTFSCQLLAQELDYERVHKDNTFEVFGSKFGYEVSYIQQKEEPKEVSEVYRVLYFGPIGYQQYRTFDFYLFIVIFALLFMCSLVFVFNKKLSVIRQKYWRHFSVCLLIVLVSFSSYCFWIKSTVTGSWISEDGTDELIFHSIGDLNFVSADQIITVPYEIDYMDLLNLYVASSDLLILSTGDKAIYSPASIRFIDGNKIETHWGMCGNSPRVLYIRK